MSFNRFEAHYSPDPGFDGDRFRWSASDTRRLLGVEPLGFTDFVGTRAHRSYNGGLLRFFLPGVSPSLEDWNSTTGWVAEWDHLEGRLAVFASDWLGRQIALDRRRISQGEPLVGILEPGTGQLLEVPQTFADFLETELVDFKDAALASNFYDQWIGAGGRRPSPSECVGYRVPLFLNGSDSIENLEITDMSVYVSLCGQLEQQTRGLAPGTKVGRVKID
ncbi:MAG: DUF1851 domain-containing protein [Vicinamibacteria bacterium]|nr:DUF1851 domain-containing protein [Vicinamibacteria bacterium]